MQDVDRPADIQSLSQPAGKPGLRVEVETVRDVCSAEGLDRIGRDSRRRRDVGQRPAMRTPELQRAVRRSLELIALLVHRAVMPATEQREVRQRGRAPLRPVPDVMPLAEWQSAAREPAAPVAMQERAPQRRRNRPGSRPDLDETSILVVLHYHPRRVACEPLRRFCRNARAVLEDGLSGLFRVGQHRGIDMNDDLVSLGGSAGVEPMVQRRLREQG